MHPSRPEAHTAAGTHSRVARTHSRVAGTHMPAVDSHSRAAGTHRPAVDSHSWAEALPRRAAQPPGQATCLQGMQRQARQQPGQAQLAAWFLGQRIRRLEGLDHRVSHSAPWDRSANR